MLPAPPAKHGSRRLRQCHIYFRTEQAWRAGRRPGPEAPTRGGGGTGTGRERLRSRVGSRGCGAETGLELRASSPVPRRALQVGWPQARLGAGPAALHGRQSGVWLLADTGPGPVGRPLPGAAFSPQEPLAPRQDLGQTGILPTRETAERGAMCPATLVLCVPAGLQRSKRCGGTASAQHRTDNTGDSAGTCGGGAEMWPCCAN